MNIHAKTGETPIACSPIGMPILQDRSSDLISMITALFNWIKEAVANRLSSGKRTSLQTSQDPFNELIHIQEEMRAILQSDSKTGLSALIDRLEKIQARSRTDEHVASTVAHLLSQPATYERSRPELEKDRKVRFESAKREIQRLQLFMEKAAEISLLRTKDVRIDGQKECFDTNQSKLELIFSAKVEPSRQRAKVLAQEVPKRAKKFATAKAHLETRSVRLLRGQAVRMEQPVFADDIKGSPKAYTLAAKHKKDFTYAAIQQLQADYKQAKDSIHKRERKVILLRTEIELVEQQITFLESQKFIEQARQGLAQLHKQGQLLKLKLIAQGTGPKADAARKTLLAYANKPQENSPLERRNAAFDAIRAKVKQDYQCMLCAIKQELTARADMDQEAKAQIYQQQLASIKEQLRNIDQFAQKLAASQLQTANRKDFVTVPKTELEKHLDNLKQHLTQAKGDEQHARGLLALEGKSVADLEETKAQRIAYIGAEGSFLRHIRAYLQDLKKYDKPLAKSLAKTPILEIEVPGK